jgi:hypothetical protein
MRSPPAFQAPVAVALRSQPEAPSFAPKTSADEAEYLEKELENRGEATVADAMAIEELGEERPVRETGTTK